ncbi:Dos2-interacting transcription regulator of RNA-Pol-II-domain-containing protein [Mycotypha africana]|uniref:Dos2-interacting transcription regulator of RNA-Pol-II-domain-containing protein n=1 Tax=Mycotypha africana TaxID=64632 RepID=UPI002300C196|nr:Dos2-interacting transcription regulator of RNA-Pol-II-domain-containing protein [Mycotypha africana]KAI8971461.1 Dos2-interacting transcription regulator of RNA-Pol-II-domain-containing protein [Mycotypha africana]
MSNLEHVVTNYMITDDVHSAEAIQASKDILKIVDEGVVQDNLLQLVQALGEYLINDDEYIRAKATALLSNTLAECKQDEINETAVSVLVDFYCERLTDGTCVPSLLEGLVALTKYSNFTGKNAVTTAKRLIQNLQMQQYPQGTRIAGFTVFANLIDYHAAALKSINDEFVFGFTKQLDGEKDPRNLMRAFHIVKELVDKLDISNHVEDVFEVTFCYFPITFKPPPGNPYGITAEDLKASLRMCMASTPLFAKFALPLILEKLSSTAGSAKKDAMETLAACAPVYGAAVLIPHIEEIYTSLKIEVFHSIDASLEDAAVDAIRSVTCALTADNAPQDSENTAEKALKHLIDECATNLRDPDMKDHQQSGRILRAVASASHAACLLVVDIIVPLVLRQYRETNMAMLRKANVDIILELLEAGKTLYGCSNDVNKATAAATVSSPLIQYKEKFSGIFESSLMASNEYNLLRLSGLNGLKLMILSKDFLETNEVGIAIQSINKILLEEIDEELRSAALEALSITSQTYCKYINEITIPSLIDRLPDNTVKDGNKKYSRLLHAFKVLASVPSVYKQAMPLLIEKFNCVCKQDEDPTYAVAIAKTILDIIKTKSSENHQDLLEGVHTIIPHFIKTAVETSITAEHNLILDGGVMDALTLTITAVLVKADSNTQKKLMERAFRLFVDGQLSEFDIATSSDVEFKPLNSASSKILNSQQKSTCRFFAAIICSLRKDVALPVTGLEGFLNDLIAVALESDNQVQLTSVARMIGSLINKWKNNSALAAFVKPTASRLEDIIAQQTTPDKGNAVEIYLWIAKALVLRTHSFGYEMTNKIIQWCGDNTAGSKAPQGFSILIGEDAFALNKAMFATTMILYKQRFFEHCLSQLVDGFRSASDDIKPNYLIALSYLLQNVPKQILLNELPPLVPLLMQSLTLRDSDLKVSTLETLSLAVSEAADIVAPQIRVILPALVGLLQDTKENPLRVRIAALKCLAQFPNYISKDALSSHVNYVIRQLKTSLDDKKRLVRKEAVDCRFNWYNIAV